MGDGRRHAHIEEQQEIGCGLCHSGGKQLELLADAAGKNGEKERRWPVINNIVRQDGIFFLKGKIDGRLHRLDEMDETACLDRLHGRLSCQACHSRWVPQCYGCHITHDRSGQQRDNLARKETRGRWSEQKSWMRYASPVLGVMEAHREPGRPVVEEEKVVILVPG
jgi:hypothetical protein